MLETEKNKPITLSPTNGTGKFQEPYINGSEYEIDIFTIVRIFWQRKRLIIGGTIFFGLLGGVVSKLLPPSYQAKAVLQIGRKFVEGASKIQLIESLDTAKDGLLSEKNLMGLAKELGIEYDYNSIKNAFVITSDERDVTPIPELFVNIAFSNREPAMASKAVNFVAGKLIESEESYYPAAFSNLDQTIKQTQRDMRSNLAGISRLQDQIAAMNAQFELDKKYDTYHLNWLTKAFESESKAVDQMIRNMKIGTIKPDDVTSLQLVFDNRNSRYEQLLKETNDVRRQPQERDTKIANLSAKISELQAENESLSRNIEKLESYRPYIQKTELLSSTVASEKRKTSTLHIFMLSSIVGFIATFGFFVLYENRHKIILRRDRIEK